MPADADLRQAIVAEARAWIGTPYRHQGAARGAGADCLGLVRGIWRALYGAEPEPPPPYSPDWVEVSGTEPLCAAARRHMTEIPLDQALCGDMLMFRMRRAAAAKHVAILAARPTCGQTIIHAYSRHAVVESALTRPWRARRAFAFRFPALAPPLTPNGS